MDQNRFYEISKSIGSSSVAVIGDVMLDVYYWGLVDRISPEAPVPVVKVEKTDSRPGGAANVACNLVSLGCEAPLVGLVGAGQRDEELVGFMEGLGIDTGYLLRDGSRSTTEKIRIVAHNQQVVRADFETEGDISGEVLEKILRLSEKAVEGAGAVVISDYGKGMVTAGLMDHVRSICGETGVPILVDPKEGHFSLYRGAFIITPNKKEAGGFYNRRIKSEEDLLNIGGSLIRDLEAHAVLITRGEEGMTLFREDREPADFPTMASEVYDVTGAGDTVISVLAAAIAAGAEIEEGIELANEAAGIVVREIGTAAVTLKELAARFDS